MNLIDKYEEFKNTFTGNFTIDPAWYLSNCGVFSKNKTAKALAAHGNYSEEWYRARFVWSITQLGLFPKENIMVEFAIPKGSPGSKSLEPDLIVFKDNSWKSHYDSWDKMSAMPETLREQMLMVGECKNNHKQVVSAVTKQMAEAMNSYIGNEIFGIYIDDALDVLLFKKEGTYSIKRYDSGKSADGENLVAKLNLNNRDNLTSLPSYDDLIKKVNGSGDVAKLDFSNTEGIDEDTFSGLLALMNRDIDRLALTRDGQDFIVEFLTLKVADEKQVKKGKKSYFEFYVKDTEVVSGFGNQVFRQRINNLYASAKSEYKNIFKHPVFWYNSAAGGTLKPSSGDDEKFLIGIVKLFQKKTILGTKNASFNQIIFNNFGNSVKKAKEKQFFTPVPIVETIVKMINPQKNETVCDPCSGICDFLAMAFRHIYKNELENLPSADMFYGLDKDDDILKLAELNLVLNGDGNAQIKIMDSLGQKLLEDGTYQNFIFDDANYNYLDWTNFNDSSKNVKKFDVIITNPPFGKGRDLVTGKDGEWALDKKTMELYESWIESGRPKSIDMGILFLENAYKLLNDGGRMAIILSNSIASIAEWEPVRKWFINHMRIVALFDLPARTFGETGVATTVFIAYKPKKTEKNILDDNYEIFVKEIENIGYTVKISDRIVTMSPDYVINADTFEREKDSKGNDKLLSDFPDLVNEFGTWLNDKRQSYPEIYKAFSGDNYKKMDD